MTTVCTYVYIYYAYTHCVYVRPIEPMSSIYAVAPMDYDPNLHPVMKFDECVTRYCLNVTVNDDMTLEKVESFYVTHAPEIIVTFDLDDIRIVRIRNVSKAEIKIVDNECKNL